MSEVQKVDVSPVADASELRELILAEARLVQISKKDVLDKSHQFAVDGPSLVLRTTDTVLAVSRRDGGLRHMLAFYTVCGYSLGIIFINADETLMAVCFDPADGATQDWIASSRRLSALQLVLSGQQNDWRLMRIPSENILHALHMSADSSSTTDAATFFASATALIQQLIAGRIGDELVIDMQRFKRVEAHYLIPQSEEAVQALEDLSGQATLH